MDNKEKYGEVFTPETLVQEMYHEIVKQNIINNYNIQNIFEPGAGKGIFYEVFQNHHNAFKGYYMMNEINPLRYSILMQIANHSNNTNIIDTDVVIDDVHNLDFEGSNYYQNFDLVLGNLPFNGNGKKITPGNKERNNLSTKYKATSIWTSITHLMFQKVLKYGGLYYCIIPSIWMKEDRAGIYDLFCKKYKIHFIKCYDCYQAHKIFNYNCHTPICYLLVEKKYRIYPNINQFLPYIIEKQNYIINQIYIEQSKLYKNSKDIPICYSEINNEPTNKNTFYQHIDYSRISILKCYDSNTSNFILFPHAFHTCLPTKHYELFTKSILYFITWNKHIERNMGSTSNMTLYDIIHKVCFIKPNVLKSRIHTENYTGNLQNIYCTQGEYKIITGATILKNNNQELGLNGFISTEPGCHQGKKKIILPHKRYLRILRDYSGTYGIYGRDMYVFLCNTNEEIDTLANFLELEFVKSIVEEGFTVRMNFIEKHVYQYLPNIYHNLFNLSQYLNVMNH